MRHIQRHPLIWLAALALAVATAWVGLQPSLAPTTLTQAIAGAGALCSIFALGVAGLAVVRDRSASLRISGAAAVLLSAASLMGALQGLPQLAVIGVCNFAFAAGLWFLAIRPAPKHVVPPPQSDFGE